MTKIEPKIGDIWVAPNFFFYLVTNVRGDNVELSALHRFDIKPIVPKSHFQHGGWDKK